MFKVYNFEITKRHLKDKKKKKEEEGTMVLNLWIRTPLGVE